MFENLYLILYFERAMLTPLLLRCQHRLLYRSQHGPDALAAPERHFALEQRVRRLEPDIWDDNMGDAGPWQRHVAGAAVCSQRCRSDRSIGILCAFGGAGQWARQPHFARQAHWRHTWELGSGLDFPWRRRCGGRVCDVRDGVFDGGGFVQCMDSLTRGV